MKKNLIKLLVATLLFTSIAGVSPTAFAEEPKTEDPFESAQPIDVNFEESVEEVSSDDDTIVYEVTAEELGINNDSFKMVVEESTEEAEEMTVYSEFETGYLSFASELSINIDTGDFHVTEEQTSETGQVTETTYDIFFNEIEGENFIAYLIDRNTGELYEVNTIDAQASAIPVLALVLKQGAKWAIKKYGKKALISAFGKYALSNAIKKVAKLTVKDKHLKSDKRGYQKFNTDSQTTAKGWIKEALQKASVSNFEINDNEKLSFKFEVNLGKKVGTKGETKIRIVIGYDGKIWTAFPVK
ncbi:SAR2788 family putative toxin [Bacillus suaedae]|uniref:SAR2788 family putative toxin n=1 Tax=Halalkalibacter suaedae TaxID=2822140 RepID=A0A941APU0_9BACI|nr:SAR2788 family putative toxin [Bacillus suaedae]MBP3953140.1 SAR2788 family putative toxin [Bacillus suaedae]